MEKRIGGFLGFEQSTGHEYYEEALRFNLARMSLVYAIKTLGYKRILIPYYICDCIPNTLDIYNIEYEYYHINMKFEPLIDDIDEYDAVLIINYWGCLDEAKIKLYYNKFHGRIIVDNTQAFFVNVGGVSAIYSCRKWFGVSDGAYLTNCIKTQTYDDYENDYSSKRVYHLAERLEKRDSELYEIYKDLEDSFDCSTPKKMSKFTFNALKSIDYDAVKIRRLKNWEYLNECIGELGEYNIISNSIPFMYVMYTNKADGIRKNLKKQNIYLPMLWPNNLKLDDTWIEHKLAANLLCLPIDQQYTEDDMFYLGQTVLDSI